MTSTRLFASTARLIALFQFALGAAFLIAPGRVATLLSLEPAAPGWAHWLFAMMGARFLGYGWGMWWAARHPESSAVWVDSMIGIQAIDWIATLVALVNGDVRFSQVTTASFMPVLFIGVLARHRLAQR